MLLVFIVVNVVVRFLKFPKDAGAILVVHDFDITVVWLASDMLINLLPVN